MKSGDTSDLYMKSGHTQFHYRCIHKLKNIYFDDLEDRFFHVYIVLVCSEEKSAAI